MPEPGAARSSNNNNEKCPLPKVKPKAVVAPPRTDQNVANGYPDLEKEILYGKETTILVWEDLNTHRDGVIIMIRNIDIFIQ